MTPERFQKIEQLCNAALEREASQRQSFLAEACQGDDELRREVESLLIHGEETKNFLEVPAIEAAAKTLGEDSGPSLVGRQLGCYQVLSLIGAGGMGEVYRAHDTKLGRDVAIKVLPSNFGHDPERLARFQREARTLASLNHPNIATIHELEQSDGVHYLVMELVAGDTLAERLKAGPLGIEEALKLSGQIAEALEAAHEKGVMHRDLKPANVKVTPEGRVKVLDFGLAKAFVGDGGQDLSHGATLTTVGTEEGRILGTPAYMSPEQARGKPVDKRTDIWAFGCVLYELLSGQRMFSGETLPDTLAAVLEREPDWQALPASTPPKIRDLLGRCLQKDPQRRLRDLWDARLEIEEALTVGAKAEPGARRDTDWGKAAPSGPGPATQSQPWWRRRAALWIPAVALVALAAGLSYKFFAGRGETINSLAVLPFVNASSDPVAEYLSDGISESLINSLSQLPNLKVMSRESAFRYKGKGTDAQTVGRELGVRAVFEGRVVQRDGNLAISAELIDARDNSHIWGQQYNRKTSDIFVLQDEIAKEITTTLRLRLTGDDEKRLAKRYTENAEAYELYLKGRYWWNKRTDEGFKKGIEEFQQAIEKDPSYALAYAGLADCYSFEATYGVVPPKEAYPKAKEAALKALEINDKLANVHTSLAWINTEYDWDRSGAEREFQRALELNPRDADAHRLYGESLRSLGRFDEAIAEFKRAVTLDPTSLTNTRALGAAYHSARQYDQAIEQFRKTLEMDPNYRLVQGNLGFAYLQKGMYDEAIAGFEKAGARTRLGYAYAVAGKKAAAQKVLDQLIETSNQKYVPASSLALIYTGLGEKDKAFEWLEKGYAERAIGGPPVGIKVEPEFDPLRSDPRFQDLLRRMNLAQ